jgi:gamma-D-glutamyl-L-lysine dipeptidyl-peptidase
MDFGICLQSIVAVRNEPTHKSELTNQILFGELYRVLRQEGAWIRVQQVYDNYEGWIDLSQHTPLPEEEFLRLADAETPTSLDIVQLVTNETKKIVFPIVAGSSLPGIEELRMVINGDTWMYDGQVSNVDELQEIETPQERIEFKHALVHDASMFLNAPYLWGGRSPFGLDCSGFVQMAYKMRNIMLLRDSSQQLTQGEIVSMVEEAEPGDLAFFDNEEGVIVHTGMMVDKNRIIHASGRVRIDTIDHYGIYMDSEKRYTHKLRVIKRIF